MLHCAVRYKHRMSDESGLLLPGDIEAIERATLAAMPPEAVEEIEGWLLPMDHGTVGRSHSATPLHHGSPNTGVLDLIEIRYRASGLSTVLRLPRASPFDRLFAQVKSRGYVMSKPTRVQVADAGAIAKLPSSATVELTETAGEEWTTLFLGEGFDPVDGASRLGILRRGRSSLYASVRVDGELVAAGCGCVSNGWVSAHGMRTQPAYRGRGLATSILVRFAKEAQARGVPRFFLQVDQSNTGAMSVYRRAGFADAWTYEYWKR
jgi:N-acetylglutamate synthase